MKDYDSNYWDIQVEYVKQDQDGKWFREGGDNDYYSYRTKQAAFNFYKKHKLDKNITHITIRFVDEYGEFDEDEWYDFECAGKAQYYK